MIYGNIIAEGSNNNAMFKEADKIHGGTLKHAFKLLRQTFLAQGIEINTPDINQGRLIAFELLIDGRYYADEGIPKYLIALENPNINRLNENLEYCRRFAKVFAWDTRLHCLPNVVKILIPNHLSFGPFPAFTERNIFSCLINANKAFRDTLPSDLYLERINTICWYEKCAPGKFELYGMGWTKPTPAFDFWGKVRRSVPSLGTKLFGYKPFPSYRGEVRDKGEVLRRSKFSYCYENTRDITNYITEKIFDCFLSGCVPIYWGADNVLDYIPEDCFINRSAFKNTAAVHEFLLSVSPEDYARYQSNVVRFLNSDIAKMFSSECFVSTIAGHVSQDIRGISLKKQ
jgi:hypothetical protein